MNLQPYLDEIAQILESHQPGWTIEGSRLIGPATFAVDVTEHVAGGVGDDVSHVDIGFMLNRDRADVPVITDCTTGMGADDAAKAKWAIGQWARVTLHPILELLEQQGRLAGHSDGNDGIGIPGWHSILGDLVGWESTTGSVAATQQWFGEAAVLPALAELLEPHLEGRLLSWVRFFFGGNGVDDVAEVRINNEYSEAASRALHAMDWPRPTSHGYLKMCVLVIPLAKPAEPVAQP